MLLICKSTTYVVDLDMMIVMLTSYKNQLHVLYQKMFLFITEENKCVLIPNYTDSLEQIDKELQQSSYVFDDPVNFYV
jgi:hypothetical protein